MKIVTLKTSRRRERGEVSDIDEDSDIEDIKKRGKGESDIDEDMTLKTSRRGERGER